MRDLKVVSWDGLSINDGVNYIAGTPGMEWGLPPAAAQRAKRTGAWPVFSGLDREARTITLTIQIIGSDKRALRDQLLRRFDPDDESPKRLVIADEDGTDQRYVEAICEQVSPLVVGSAAAVDTFTATLVVHGDPRWRAVTPTQDTWNITTSGQTHTIINPGTDDAYPVLRIKPTVAKSGGFAYRRFVAVTWRSSNAAGDYPVMATLDTATLIAAGKMQADGDDLRVLVDGREIDRWLAGINTASTKIWWLLSFQPTVAMTLKTAIPATGAITTIEVNGDISRMPQSGILMIDSEIFVYTAKDDTGRYFSGITRAAKGSAEAAHTAGTAVHWLQHEIWLAYGNASLAAPTVDDRKRPAFDYANSDNGTWAYTEFGDSDEMRAGRWGRYGDITLSGKGGCYTQSQLSGTGSPYAVAGVWISETHGNAYGWHLVNPCGITGIAWQDGYKRRRTTNTSSNDFVVHCMNWPRGATWWNWHYNPPRPTSVNIWESWSWSGTFAVSDVVALAAYFLPQDVEVGGATITLNAGETPTVAVGSELGNYELRAAILNQTTGDRIEVSFVMDLNSELEIDCYNRTVTWLKDNSRQLSAITVPIAQRHWMRLAPGSNTLAFTDAGTTGVTLTTKFEARYY